MRKSSLLGEFAAIVKNKKLLIAITAILFIPLLYSGVYLWAFLDPYSRVDDLPVAVVNNDVGTVYNDKKTHIGQDLVDDLKKNDSFNWKFVDEATAKRGLENQDYYMMIEIPKDFSKNATTLQQDDPKHLQLVYTANEGSNYVSSQIGTKGVEKIKNEVSKKVTENYAEEMFDNVKEVSKGLADAGDGATKLRDGINDAKDGTGKLEDGITSANKGANDLNDGAKKLQKGTSDLNDGAGQLEKGAGDVHNGAVKLEKGSKDLNNGVQSAKGGADKLAKGANDLNDGVTSAKGGADKLAKGANDLNDGVTSAKGGADKLAKGANDLNDGVTSAKGGADKLAKGANDLNDGVTSAKGGADKLAKGAGDLSSGLGQLQSANTAILEGAKKSQTGAQSLATAIDQGVGELKGAAAQISQFKANAKKVVDGVTSLSQLSSGLQKNITDATASSSEVSTGIQNTIDDLDKQIAAAADPAQKEALQKTRDQLAPLVEKSKAVSQNVTGMNESSTKMNAVAGELAKGLGDSSADSSSSGDLETKLTELSKGANALAAGQTELVDGLTKFGEKLGEAKTGSDQLATGGASLSEGLGKLSEGSTQLAAGTNDLSSGLGKLSDGSSQLAAGNGDLSNGLGKLSDGSSQLAAGNGDLSNGLGKLSDGSSQLATGSGDLSSGLGKLSDGSGQLTTGISSLADGSGKVANGMTGLKEGSTKLLTGTTQLIEGTGQLSNGMGKLDKGAVDLNGGLGKLSDGSSELATKLQDGAKDAGDVKANQAVYDMFADPVQVKDNSINNVPNYGTGLTPYFLSVALFVGALVTSVIFPLRKPAITPKNGFRWFLGKFGVLVFVGIMQSLLADAILLGALDIKVQSVPLFITLSIATSLTFMSIIQFFVTALDNPGRFVAILIMVFQLATSAGTFPVELIPKVLQDVNHWLPMTYSVRGFRAVVSTGDFSYMWHNVSILAIYFVIMVLASISFFMFKFAKDFKSPKQAVEN
ncbi:YhgE/Pip domain-containing protein [Priestia koreensis]|uniref:YhgE/Pip domain-containing protein n=1 Tax=Priestia koreensis TaxID=284581 RepID=UPI001F59F498|nr:YhgE/Pip domain-containing protein [Priestia koreensis]UNL85571.1 YhgE/Pip domain-containing protein [Priestia koreensis]